MTVVDFIKTIQSFGMEWFRRYYSLYRAEVMDNDDPQNRGRIRVMVPFISQEALDEWAIPVTPYGGNKYGTFFPPEKGDYVWVMFENGDMNYPIYVGGWWAEGETPDGFSITRRGIRTKNCELYFDDKNNVIKATTPNAEIKVDDTAKEINIKTQATEISLDEGAKKITIKADTNVTVEATSVQVNADSIKCGSGASKTVLLDQDKHTCVVVGIPVPTTSTATKTKAE